MDLSNLQQTWNRLEQKMDQNNRINLELLRKVNLDRAQNKLKSLVWQQAITIAFYLLAGSYFMYFTATHWGVWHYVASGSILAVWSFIATASAIYQLQLILNTNYSAPVLQLQKRLMNLKISIIKNLRLAGWVLPFYMAFLVVGFEILFGTDVIREADRSFLILNVILSILFVFVGSWIHNKLSPQNADKEWLNWLIQGSGSQVNEALEFLKEIDEFERNEAQ
ncbi:MAG: hypothetical protein GVY20_00970 [Bacteroidetes bacterium]|jgi:hypothetical protein|nr:hypothetical protein [Bacteroidota bacterium]